MTSSFPDSNIVASYELSLSIGNSLDINKNAKQFIDALVEKEGVDFAAVWITADLMDEQGKKDGFSLAYGLPKSQLTTNYLPSDVLEYSLLKEENFLVLTDNNPVFKLLIKEATISGGSYALYRLADIGFLKIHTASSETKQINRFEELKILVDKFSVSLQACLAHLKATDNETRIANIIDSALDAVVLINAEGYVTHWNRQATQIFGWTKEEAIGTDMATLFIPHRHRTSHNTGMKHYHATGEGPVINQRIEITAINKEGKEFDVELTVVPIKLRGGTTAFSGFIRDITDAKAAKQTLIEAREKAEASVRAKEEFLANMSHEVRTPLNAIKGMGELLGYSKLDPTQTSYVHAIERSTKNLLVIVNDILDFSKIEAGKVDIEKVGFDLQHMTEVLFHSEKTKAFKKGIDFRFEYDERIAPILISDPVRINQVLLNLIGNALKFTKEGHILLKVELLYATPTINAIRFIVKDTGIGIETKKIESVFDEFTQADASITRRFGGTGLGLTISRKLVELLNGHISVESKVNEGSTFSVVMNLGIGTSADLPNLEIDQQKVKDLKGKNILLVEDHDLNQMLAIAILEELGMNVVLAENGQEAVDQVKATPHDLILMDMQMPIMDGLEATAIIRDELKNPIPIIALTANATQEHKKKCLEAGMNDYVAKPFESAVLVSKIHGLLIEDHTIVPTVTIKKEEPVAAIAELVEVPVLAYDIAFLQRTTRGNKAMMHRLLTTFIDKTPVLLDDLGLAIKQKNWEKVRATAHKMKPSLGILGALELRDITKRMEANATKLQHLDSMPNQFQKLDRQTHILIEELKELL